METRTVKILQNTMAGGEFVHEGDELELSRREAHLLTNIGRATYTDRMIEPKCQDPRATDTTELIDGKGAHKGRTMTSENTAVSKGKKKS